MTTLYLRLPVVVDDADPMRCGETCPGLRPAFASWRCSRFGLANVDDTLRRIDSCLAATNAAIDAEIAASVSGMRHAMDLIDEHGTGVSESVDRALVEAEISRLEARKVKP